MLNYLIYKVLCKYEQVRLPRFSDWSYFRRRISVKNIRTAWACDTRAGISKATQVPTAVEENFR